METCSIVVFAAENLADATGVAKQTVVEELVGMAAMKIKATKLLKTSSSCRYRGI